MDPFNRESYHVRPLRALVLIGLLPAALAACGDDPLAPQDWVAAPDSITLFSASRVELVALPSAFDVVSGIRLAIEDPGATGQWDVLLAEVSGGLVLVPAAAFEVLGSRARVAFMEDQEFDSLVRAPGDTAAYSADPVPVHLGGVYVLRSRRTSCQFFGSGSQYAKIEVVEVNAAAGNISFRIIRNPNCGDRDLVPPDDR